MAGRGAADRVGADAGGELTVCANAEVYNHRALRAELAQDGYRFRTGSDTEVILALYARDGIQGLARIRGMFALALWDAARGRGYRFLSFGDAMLLERAPTPAGSR